MAARVCRVWQLSEHRTSPADEKSITGDLDWVDEGSGEGTQPSVRNSERPGRRHPPAPGRRTCRAASPPSTSYRVRKFIKRNRTGVIALRRDCRHAVAMQPERLADVSLRWQKYARSLPVKPRLTRNRKHTRNAALAKQEATSYRGRAEDRRNAEGSRSRTRRERSGSERCRADPPSF